MSVLLGRYLLKIYVWEEGMFSGEMMWVDEISQGLEKDSNVQESPKYQHFEGRRKKSYTRKEEVGTEEAEKYT